MTPDEHSPFQANLLLQLVEGLQVPFAYEPSFRLCPFHLLSNRFLLTVSKQDLAQHSPDTLLALCQRIAMPEACLAATRQNLDAARFIHFGFEENESSCLYKVYLEFGFDAQALAKSVPLHLAFKWDIADPACFVRTEYIWHPKLSAVGIVEKLAHVFGADPSEALDIAKGMVELSAARSNREMNYLEVSEASNGRRSFDVNLYDANLRMRDFAPFLERICRLFSVAAAPFQALYEGIESARFGHVAGGRHRAGQEFFNIYYGAEKCLPKKRMVRGGWDVGPVKRLDIATDQDQYYNYCWWPYLPVAPAAGKLRGVNLLLHSFEAAGVTENASTLVEKIRAEIGPFRTVWGTKWIPPTPSAEGTLAWEFYFYDYQRRQRTVSITRLLEAIKPLVQCDVPVNEALAYFMFSLDLTGEIVAGARPLDVVHMYVGNPGSKVSSGIAYAVTPTGTTLENFYFFFDAKRDLREAAEKIFCSAHVDADQVDIDQLLLPELRDCHTICVANKQRNDTVYFSGVTVEQLLFFLKKLSYPLAIVTFVEENRARLDHLLYDVGFDYVTRGHEVEFVKSGYYGIF